MPSPAQDTLHNLLLRRLSEADYALLSPHLEPFQAPLGTILFRADEPVTHAWFLETAIGSLIAESPEGLRAEAGLFGREGFCPTALALDGDRTAYECVVQGPGAGYRIAAAPFRAAVGASDTLRVTLLKFAQALSVQSGFTALSNAVHPVDERLARWLLMCDDRTDSGEIRLTHEFMAVMLAVRRPSVTTALHVLEGAGLIRAERGLVTVLKREALEEFAGDAYGKPELEYERLLGPFR